MIYDIVDRNREVRRTKKHEHDGNKKNMIENDNNNDDDEDQEEEERFNRLSWYTSLGTVKQDEIK